MIQIVPKFNYYPPLTMETAQKITQSARGIMSEPIEHIFVYARGNLLSSGAGKKKSVTFDGKTLRKLPIIGAETRTTLGHNHPSETDLSPDDMMTSFRYNITDTFAITPKGNCYVMTLPKLSDEERQAIDSFLLWPFYENKGMRLFCKFMGNKASKEIKAGYINRFKRMFEKFGAKFNTVGVDKLADLLSKKA